MNDVVENVEASKLASFETAHTQQQIAPIVWSVEKFRVAQMIAIDGKTKTAIAKELGIPLSAINTWLKHPDYKAYIEQTVLDAAKAIKNKKLQLLIKTLAAREAEAELEGYSTFSRKDSLDIMTEIRKETGEERAADTSYTQLLEKMVLNSAKGIQPLKVINAEDV